MATGAEARPSRNLAISEPITAGLLCGGQGRRLGGPKEQLSDSTGRSLLAIQVERLIAHFHNLLLLTGEAGKCLPAVALAHNVQVVSDPPVYQGYGPMAGLLAGLRLCRTPWLALIPIDNPYFPCDAFAETLQRVGSGRKAIGWIDHEERFQWLPGLYHRELIPSLEESLSLEELSFGRWVKAQQRAFVPWQHGQVSVRQAFSNLNTPEQARLAGFVQRQGA